MAKVLKTDIEKLRSVNWDKGNLWEISFPEIEDKFGFVPVNDVEINFGAISFEAFSDTYFEYPTGRTTQSLSLSFLDNVNLDFLMFLKDWKDKVVPKNLDYVYAINDAKKLIIINKLDQEKNKLLTFSCYVIPNSDITYHGESDGNIPQYTITFNITTAL